MEIDLSIFQLRINMPSPLLAVGGGTVKFEIYFCAFLRRLNQRNLCNLWLIKTRPLWLNNYLTVPVTVAFDIHRHGKRRDMTWCGLNQYSQSSRIPAKPLRTNSQPIDSGK